MSTKISEFSSNLMSNALSSLKEAKTKKAEAAFYSFLDSAVNGNASNSKTDDFQSIGGTQNANKEYQAEDWNKNNADNSNIQNLKTEKSVQQVNDSNVDKTDLEKAEDIIDDICEELDVTREELFTQFDQLLSAIAAMLMEKFNVSEQELNRVLDSLGLSLMDMFNQADFMQTIVMLSGAEDISAILTDENLYQQVQEVSEELVSMQEAFVPGKVLDAEQMQELKESINTIMNASEEKTVNVKENTDINLDEPVLKDEPVLEIMTDKTTDRSNDSQGQQMTGNEGFQQFAGRVAEYVDNTAAAAGNEFVQQADMESIIRQITDYIKLQVHAETTSLEMQLHPESYGKLNLQVSVRDGVVTAKMAVENEMVKSALESQVVQLREDMNERGLKVDAVEVAIASHEFERNLEEGQENHESAQEEMPKLHRQINLQEEGMSLEELAAMSEAEVLTRKIMLENGNSIDFSA